MAQNHNILTPLQASLLEAIGREAFFKETFYLTGGTALAAFYLQHRYSEDLDFFSAAPVDTLPIVTFFRTHKSALGIKDISSQTSMNRNLFFLETGEGTLKAEFTYFPFVQIEKPQEHLGVPVDSPKDIAVNKLFTVYQRSQARDYVDLYFIHREYSWSTEQLMAWARAKFDWHIDPLQLAAQFSKAREVRDYPRLIKEISKDEWQQFFETEALKLKPNILK